MRPNATGGTRPALILLMAVAATTLDGPAAAQAPEAGSKKEPASEPPAAAEGDDEVAPEAKAGSDRAATEAATTTDEAAPGAAAAGEPVPAPEPEAATRAEPEAEPVEAAPAPAPPPAESSAKAAETTAPEPTTVAATTTKPVEATAEEQSWFYRPPFRATFGEGNRQLSVTLYGFLQADFIYDTTRSYSEQIGSSLVARTDTYDGTVPRTQFSSRNTRFGFRFESAELGGIRPVAVLEGDFFGNQPAAPPDQSEQTYYESPTFRLRHAYLELENDVVDVLMGLTYDVFGWQNRFFPCSAELLGLPNQVYSRNTQLRLSHAFGAEGPVGVEVATAAVRPAQRDSSIPDANAGLLFTLNHFRGIATSGSGITRAQPLSLGVSGTLRHFKVDAFTPPPTQTSNSVLGWGLSVDALVPVIPAHDEYDRSNALTIIGSFVTGTGIGDLMNATGGATFPTLPNPALANPPPEYHGNIDPGIVSFDTLGVLHTIDWQGFKVGLQYYLPPSGRFFFAANYTQAYSANLQDLFPQGGAEIELLTHVADRSQYVDANLFFDATPAVRLGVAGAYTRVEYLDGERPDNFRGHVQGLYFF